MQMHEMDDHTLLREHAEHNSEAAFAALVARHVDKVYSVALRHTRNAHAAEEITQAVFVILAKKSGCLGRKVILSGWLYETSRLTAVTYIRSEIRRTRREQEAHMQIALNENDSEVWPHIAPLLDDALAGLSAADRHAIVLRYFDDKSLGEVGAALGTSEDAAKKRVTRAVEKLRGWFTKRGVTLTAAVLTAAISANSVQAAPLGLVATVTAAAVKGAEVSGSTLTLIKGALKVMAWSKVKMAIVIGAGVLLAGTTGTGIYIVSQEHSPAKELETALLQPRPRMQTWSYPSDKVVRAIWHFGSNRAEAFPILKKAVEGSNAEARNQAIAAMGFIARPARPELLGLVGEPASNAIPLLREILFANEESSPLALNSLRGCFEPKDIPALASLLKQSHGYAKPENIADAGSPAQAQSFSDRANANQQLQRYIPEAIAQTIENNSNTAAAYLSSVEELLDDENADVRFGAACALAKYRGVSSPNISANLIAGLKIQPDASRQVLTPNGLKRLPSTDGLNQLMAIELLQQIGPGAKPMLPALLEFANTTKDAFMRKLAFRAAGKIDEGLRKSMPEVDMAIQSDPSFKQNPAK